MKFETKRITAILTALMVAFLFVSLTHAKVVDDVPPVGVWLFEEGKGTVAKDSSESKNDGTLKGAVKWVKGKFGSGLEFAGKKTDYVEIPNSKSLGMTEQMSVVLWFKTEKAMKEATKWADRQVVIGKHYTEYEIGIYPLGFVHTYTNKGDGKGYDEGIMASMKDKVDPDWKLGTWYHFAWTLNGKKEIAYVNGIKIGEFSKANANTMALKNPLEIGRRVGGGLPFTGTIDEVAVFNVALNPGFIKRIVEEGLAATTAVEPTGKLSTTWSTLKSQR
ncbi:hypothetical protein CMK21_07140 [Candidatus Poribacteria bacterium]|nr:hypothetical protein [Candidatus Poribacteria bacterium]